MDEQTKGETLIMEFIVIARKLENGIVQYGYDAYGDGCRKIASELLEKYNTPESVEELFSEKGITALGKTDAESQTEYSRRNSLSFSGSEDGMLGWFVDSLFFYDSDNVWYFIVAGHDRLRIKIPLEYVLLHPDAVISDSEERKILSERLISHILGAYHYTDPQFALLLSEKFPEGVESIRREVRQADNPAQWLSYMYPEIIEYFDSPVSAATAKDGTEITGFEIRKKDNKKAEIKNNWHRFAYDFMNASEGSNCSQNRTEDDFELFSIRSDYYDAYSELSSAICERIAVENWKTEAENDRYQLVNDKVYAKRALHDFLSKRHDMAERIFGKKSQVLSAENSVFAGEGVKMLREADLFDAEKNLGICEEMKCREERKIADAGREKWEALTDLADAKVSGDATGVKKAMDRTTLAEKSIAIAEKEINGLNDQIAHYDQIIKQSNQSITNIENELRKSREAVAEACDDKNGVDCDFDMINKAIMTAASRISSHDSHIENSRRRIKAAKVRMNEINERISQVQQRFQDVCDRYVAIVQKEL